MQAAKYHNMDYYFGLSAEHKLE